MDRRGQVWAVTGAAFDLSKSQGSAVLGLLERARVPPHPAFYRLFFDYVAGVKGLMAVRIGDILAEGQDDVRDRLYSEFIAPYETTETVDRALDEMVARLVTLDRLIVQSATATA
ncbi:MAG: hypothetical protein ABIY37_17735, partial [Devosia sp.]